MPSYRDPEFLADVVAKARKGSDESRVLENVMARSSERLPVHRTLSGMEGLVGAPPMSYRELERAELTDGSSLRDVLSAANCHDGQAKLALMLLEFLAGSVSGAGGRKFHLVYVGASAPAAEAARLAFPAVKQTIFDPNDDLTGGVVEARQARLPAGEGRLHG